MAYEQIQKAAQRAHSLSMENREKLSLGGVEDVKVYDRTQDAVVLYEGQRQSVIAALAAFSFSEAEAMELVPEHTARALNREFGGCTVFLYSI